MKNVWYIHGNIYIYMITKCVCLFISLDYEAGSPWAHNIIYTYMFIITLYIIEMEPNEPK